MAGQHTQPSAMEAIARVHDDAALREQPPAKRFGVGASDSAPVQQPLNEVLAQLVKIQQEQAAHLVMVQQQQAAQGAALAQALQCLAASQSSVPQATPYSVPSVTASTGPSSGDICSAIPPELDKVILTRTRAFKDGVLKLARAKKRLVKLIDDSEVFASDAVKYPRSQTPFKSQVSFAELDHPAEDSTMSEFQFMVTIPQASTRREAMRLVHRNCAIFQNKLMIEAQKEHVQLCEPLANPGVLETIVTDVLTEAGKPSHAEALGLPKPIAATLAQGVVDNRVQSLYSKIFESVNRKLAIDASATSQSQSAASAAEASVVKQKPAELISELVQTKVAAEVNSRLVEAGFAPQDQDIVLGDVADAPADSISPLAENFVEALKVESKNSTSPPVEVGHSAKPGRNGPRFKIGNGKGKGIGKKRGSRKGKVSHSYSSGKGAGTTGRK